MVFTTKIWESFGLTRDSVSLLVVKWIGVCTLLVSAGVDLHAYGVPTWGINLIRLTALLASLSAAQHRTSDLPGAVDKVSDQTRVGAGTGLMGAVLLACALAGVSISACASMPAKQKALVAAQSIESALGSAQDFERANYVALGENVPASASLRKYCPASALPEPLPANATVHQVVACLFAQAFTSQQATAVALQAWAPGAAPPTILGQLRGQVDTIFAVVKGFSQNANQQQMLSLVQSTVDSVLTIVSQVGGNVPSVVPGGVQ